MKQPIILCSPLLAALALASSANAATLYTSPTGTATTDCSRATPCDLTSAANLAMAGDTVILMDGIYKTALIVPNTGTSSAWLTFQADDCATPIIEGAGADPTSTDQSPGVSSDAATYVRFVGLVSRGWNIGYGNGWTGLGTTTSNGHFEFKYCIADSNGRTGFTFFSAEGIHIQNSISAHNGSSIAESWSSGITLYETQGGSAENVIEGNVSFENMDNHDDATNGKHSDGSGFIVDENSNGATFINNLAFGNGGSCLRLTLSSNARFINNTCYHNAQDTRDTGPTNPGEIYFSDTQSQMGISFLNNVFAATGTGPGKTTIIGKPSSGWSNNIETSGSVSYFTAPDGTNPDFTLPESASTLIGKGATGSGVPTNDSGFNPKCIVKRTPTTIGMMTKGSWWQYSVDYDYIKQIGGVAKCFNPAARSGMPDIGAYKSGAIKTSSGTCVSPGTGGASSSGGASSTGGGPSSGGASAGGATGTANAGGALDTAGSNSQPGSPTSNGGAAATNAGAGPSNGTGATALGSGGSSAPSGSAAGPDSASGSPSCGCRVGLQPTASSSLFGLGSLGLALLGVRRRRLSHTNQRRRTLER